MPISGQGCLAIPDMVCYLAQGDLKAFVGGPVRGRLYEDGHHRVDTGQGHFPPVSLPWWLFAGEYHWLCTAEDPFGYAIEWKLKPR